MPYAANGVISTSPFAGAIEITEEQHRMAVEGMCEGMAVSIDGGFSVAFPSPPELPAEVPLTLNELRIAVLAQRDALMAVATSRMKPLQYAVDLGDVTEAEEALIVAWKRYSVDLNRIELQQTFPEHIDWPLSPDTTSP